MSREEAFDYYQESPLEALFEVQAPKLELPELARLFQAQSCEACGEVTAENMLRLQDGERLCLDCYRPYARFTL